MENKVVSKEQIEQILNNIINQDITETDKCGSGGGKKKPKNKPKAKTPKQLFEEFDKKNFSKEEYSDSQNPHPIYDEMDFDERVDFLQNWDSPQGRLQKIQSDLQYNRDYSNFDKMLAVRWSTDLFIKLNSYLFDKPDKFGNKYTGDDRAITYDGEMYSVKEVSDFLSKVIDKSPRLQESCVTYRWGPVDELMNMELGEGGTFKGFQSTSWNYTVATTSLQEQTGGWMKDNRGMVRYHNMEGTKGMVIDESVNCDDWQSEWLIDKGQKYVLVGKGMVDYDGEEIMTYDVLVY